MNNPRRRPLSLDQLRAFEAVARRLSFRAAADELFVTQSAVSRQIKALEDELGALLFQRGTRKVELTADGSTLLRAVSSSLDRIDAAVHQIRSARGRRHVGVTTFASFASLWLIPRLQDFQAAHPDIDIRISASDALVDLDDPELDVALRYCHPDEAPPGALRMFGEVMTPVVGPHLARHGPPLRTPADLAQHALLEEDDNRSSAEFLSWRHWLRVQGEPQLQPLSWIYLNFTYQQIQGALAGQGVALARLALVYESIARGELIEPFGPSMRIRSPFTYWVVPAQGSASRPERTAFIDWVCEQAVKTREAIGEAEAPAALRVGERPTFMP
jgi:LysR family glycine cleavage system transcriptional activator